MKKRIFTAILCGLILTGCGGGDPQPIETASSETVPETEIYEGLEAVDFGGDTFTIANRAKSPNYNGHPYPELDATEMTGEALNDAVFMRNLVIEEKYNIKISSATFPHHVDSTAEVERAIIAGDDTYDAIFNGMSYSFQMAVNGYLYELSEIPYLQTDREWWMTNVRNNTSIAGKNYFIPGDMNIGAMNTSGLIYFNKQVIKDYNLESPYDLVNSGKWTLDAMATLAREVTHDADGNGVLDHNDVHGCDTSSFAWQPMFYGSGKLLIAKDSDDIPYLDIESEHNYNHLTAVVNFVNDSSVAFMINRAVGISDIAYKGIERFVNNQTLFFIELMYGVPQFREMESDFGLLPLPKANETQENYYTYLHPNNSSAAAVPIINQDLDEAGMILEDMAFYSSQYIRPAYYDVMLESKYARDDESSQMLDIILSNFTIDLALVMLNAGIDIDTLMRNACIEGNTEIFSTIVANKPVYTSILEQTVAEFSK